MASTWGTYRRICSFGIISPSASTCRSWMDAIISDALLCPLTRNPRVTPGKFSSASTCCTWRQRSRAGYLVDSVSAWHWRAPWRGDRMFFLDGGRVHDDVGLPTDAAAQSPRLRTYLNVAGYFAS